jgi:hypothetical protein
MPELWDLGLDARRQKQHVWTRRRRRTRAPVRCRLHDLIVRYAYGRTFTRDEYTFMLRILTLAYEAGFKDGRRDA